MDRTETGLDSGKTRIIRIMKPMRFFKIARMMKVSAQPMKVSAQPQPAGRDPAG